MTAELIDVDRLAGLVDVDRAAQWAPRSAAAAAPSGGIRGAQGIWQGVMDRARDTWSRGRDDALCQTHPTARQEPRPVPPALIRFVCGSHIEQPVDGRGRGCPECVIEHEERLAERRRRRVRALEDDTTTPTNYLI